MDLIDSKNYSICRKDLDFAPVVGSPLALVPTGGISWMRIDGISDFWNFDQGVSIPEVTADLLASLASADTYYCYLIRGSSAGVSVFVGITSSQASSLQSAIVSSFPGINLSVPSTNPVTEAPPSFGGVLSGIPTVKCDKDVRGHQLENVIRGMLGKTYAYLVIAKGLGPVAPTLADNCISLELENAYSASKQTISGGAEGNISVERANYRCQEYMDNLTKAKELLVRAMATGLWQVSVYYGASTEQDSLTLGKILKSAFSGEDSVPRPIRLSRCNGIGQAIGSCSVLANQSPVKAQHPIGTLSLSNGRSVDLCSLSYATILGSRELSAYCQLPTKEFPGYCVNRYVEFDNSARVRPMEGALLRLGQVCSSGRATEERLDNPYLLPREDLSRHALVVGITGGGKTNTAKSILAKLWVPEDGSPRIPFLVIESAKREYWELRNQSGFEEMLLFTLGDESSTTGIRYRLNPFETMSGVSLQTHIDYLLSTFKAAFELYPPMPYVLESAVYEVYSDFGWDIIENRNEYGLSEYPTIEDLYLKIDPVVDRLGYDSEVQSNVKAALKARIGSMMNGGKGAMLNTKRSLPISKLLSRPVVLELEDIGDDETKSFVIGMLLVQLFEYRKSTAMGEHMAFSHLLLVEEAHRLLKNVQEVSEGSNTKAKSVEFFCNLLAEIRSYGQGIMIADQIPTKLAPDTIKNTNLKIVHRTVAADDRGTIGGAMNMSDDQIEYLSSLPRGYAAVYSEGDNRPMCVKMPLVGSCSHRSRGDVVAEMQNRAYALTSGFLKGQRRHQGCAFCEKRCAYGDLIAASIGRWVKRPEIILDIWRERDYAPRELSAVVDDAHERGFVSDEDMFEDICYVGTLLGMDVRLSPGMQETVLARYIKFDSVRKRG